MNTWRPPLLHGAGAFFSMVGLVLLLPAGPACRGEEARPPQETPPIMPSRPIADVLADHRDELLALEGVAIVYESATAEGVPCIKVGVVENTPEVRARIPAQLEGHPVVVVGTGGLEPHD